MIQFPYFFKHGKRLTIPTQPMGLSGMTRHVFSTREALVINEDMAGAIVKFGSYVLGPALEKSSIFVPLLAGDRVHGILNLLDMRREHAFSDSDVRLLQTIANAMGAALENARLFDETQRLFKESEQRAAELAIINSVQEGLAAELDFQAIIDLVGDKVAEIFSSKDMDISLYDRASNVLSTVYYLEHGERFPIEPGPMTTGFMAHVIRTRRPLVIDKDLLQRRVEYGARSIGDPNSPDVDQSYVGVPILIGEEARGAVAMSSRKQYAFADSDVRLLTTLAATMGVALENARLFDETQRLFKESEQRAAELAIINSVQEALAAELNIQGIYDAVGDQIREIFHQGDIAIGILDPASGLVHLPVLLPSMAERVAIDPFPLPWLRRSCDAHAAADGHQ